MKLMTSTFKYWRIDSFIILFAILLLAGKEMTFAVFEDFPGIQVMYIVPLAGVMNMCPSCVGRPVSVRAKNKWGFAVMSGMSVLTMLGIVWCWCKTDTPDFIMDGCKYGSEYLKTGNKKDLQKALKCLNQASLLNPRDNILQYNIAMLYLQSGRLDEASDILDTLVSRCSSNALYRIGVGRLKMMQDDMLMASKEYTVAAILDPRIVEDAQWEEIKADNPELYKMIANNIFQFSLKKDCLHDPIMSSKIGKLMLEFEHYEEAEAYLRGALSMLPNLGRAWYNLGLIAVRKQEYSEADYYLRKAAFLLPGDESVREYLLTLNPDALVREKKNGNFLKKRAEEYSRKFRTWYRRDPDTEVILSVELFK